MLYAFSSRLPCLYTSMSVLPWCWGTNCSAELSVVNRQAKYTEPYVLTRCNSVFDVLQTVIFFLCFWAPSVTLSCFSLKILLPVTVRPPSHVCPLFGVYTQLFLNINLNHLVEIESEAACRSPATGHRPTAVRLL